MMMMIINTVPLRLSGEANAMGQKKHVAPGPNRGTEFSQARRDPTGTAQARQDRNRASQAWGKKNHVAPGPNSGTEVSQARRDPTGTAQARRDRNRASQARWDHNFTKLSSSNPGGCPPSHSGCCSWPRPRWPSRKRSCSQSPRDCKPSSRCCRQLPPSSSRRRSPMGKWTSQL